MNDLREHHHEPRGLVRQCGAAQELERGLERVVRGVVHRDIDEKQHSHAVRTGGARNPKRRLACEG